MKLFCGKRKIADNVIVCKTIFAKAMGTRFKRLKENTAYLFPVNNISLAMIDTFFVSSAIDVYFLDKRFEVVSAKKNLKPFSILIPANKTRFILEVKSRTKLKMHDKLQLTK